MMRGGRQHNEVLLAPVARSFRQRGASTEFEVMVDLGPLSFGYIDLLVQIGRIWIVVEAEQSAKRVAADVNKAAAVDAAELWIVVANPRMARAVRRKLRQLNLKEGAGIYVLTQGQALARVAHCFPLISGANVPRTTNQKAGKTAQRELLGPAIPGRPPCNRDGA